MKNNVKSVNSIIADALDVKQKMDKIIVGREAWEERTVNPLEPDFEGKHLDPEDEDVVGFWRVVAMNPETIHDERPF